MHNSAEKKKIVGREEKLTRNDIANSQHKCLALDPAPLMDGTILDSLPLAASQYPLRASLCADGGTTRRKTGIFQLGLRLEVRHYCRRL
ncbi:MAG: hypothetical protein OYL97_02570 [Candidatus Poribacteria bacterium]|nr:hypothetical protein [Candidatus Poribacteria bacterium]